MCHDPRWLTNAFKFTIQKEFNGLLSVRTNFDDSDSPRLGEEQKSLTQAMETGEKKVAEQVPNPSVEIPASSKSGLCLGCTTHPVDTVFISCGHASLCNSCCQKLSWPLKCPICRAVPIWIQEVHFSCGTG